MDKKSCGKIGGYMFKLSGKEINTVLSYIGGTGGYLGDFTYASHSQFYPMFCGLDIDPYKYEGTTRQKFMKILSEATPLSQAKILQGIVDKYPLTYFENHLENEMISLSEYENKKRILDSITSWIHQLSGQGLVEINELVYNFEFVQDTLDQCQTMISQHNCSSAIDRAHTALHGYLKETCKKADLQINLSNPKIQDYWSKLKQEHPLFLIEHSQSHLPINQIVNAVSKMLEGLNEIRNNRSFSHPNEEIIKEPEAKFVINLFRSILQYVDQKVAT
ncbi:abortive infection family protein [Paenibacillus polymyxa]|uniref:abortive infection family protein n=1 Tax=Paenibacillus polymyxa TaxID=1406 RepID=UPI002379A304|nr:abortive infection family protein [Paenibacillus polymyxa]